jgi:hypothetical protein
MKDQRRFYSMGTTVLDRDLERQGINVVLNTQAVIAECRSIRAAKIVAQALNCYFRTKVWKRSSRTPKVR